MSANRSVDRAIQTVAAEVGDVDVLASVVVDIADADALAPAAIVEAGGFGDIAERAIAVVAIEGGRRRGGKRRTARHRVCRR